MAFSTQRYALLYLAAGLLTACGGGDPSTKAPSLLAASKAASQPAEYGTVVQQLYIAYFGRPADPAGLANFQAALSAADAPTDAQGLVSAYDTNPAVKNLIDSFGNSVESSRLYAGDTTAFVTAVFNSLLNRAPQEAGRTFWVSAIDSGQLSKGRAALAIMAGALGNGTPQGLIDAAGIGKKVSVAAGFTGALTTSDQIERYSGQAAASAVRGMLNAVGASTDTDSYQSTISSAIAALPATIRISECGEITASGRYKLDADVAASGVASAACIFVHDASAIDLDCGGHAISGSASAGGQWGRSPLVVDNVQNFSVRNCKIQTTDMYVSVAFRNSSNGSIDANTIYDVDDEKLSTISVTNTSHLIFKNNVVRGVYNQTYSNDNVISDNRFNAIPGEKLNYAGALIASLFGDRNTILRNTIDGKAVGTFSGFEAADDGIVLQDDKHALVEGNSISNVFDCGIENIGVITSAVIRNNYIDNAGLCGIGGWYWSSWTDTTISANTVNNTPQLFYFFRTLALRPAGWDERHLLPEDTAVLFQNNVFDGNILTNLKDDDLFGTHSSKIVLYDIFDIPAREGGAWLERAITVADYRLTNNLFRNNRFGYFRDAPYFGTSNFVAGRVIDGGGNTCKAPTYENYPIKCN